ncbi:MAG: nitroreductase family protein [Candidatus Bathyarchaeota archaeon]|nr:MAG: nitroreductase family protein [Candidatus Bathyarchaeota archaeon]
MDIIEAIKSRRSVRKFSDKKIDRNKLITILDATRFAPSAFNRQEWRFIIIKNSETIHKLVEEAKTQPFVAEAPVVVVACAKSSGPIMSCGQPCYVIDVAIALDHLSLAALEYGVSSCWISVFNENKIKEIFDIPDKVRVIALMLLGYPSEQVISEKKRLPLTELLKFEKWSDD